MEPEHHDVLIIGGGAAGLSAALVLGRARRRVAVIDAGTPRNAPAAHMQGYLSHDGMPPGELLAAGRAEIAGYVASGLGALSFVDASTPYLPYALALLVVAAGMGLSVPSLSTGIVGSLPATQSGVGSGINSAVREIGAALGVATVGTVLASTFVRGLPASVQHHTSTFEAISAARRLGPLVEADVVDAFTDAMAVGLRAVAGTLTALYPPKPARRRS